MRRQWLLALSLFACSKEPTMAELMKDQVPITMPPAAPPAPTPVPAPASAETACPKCDCTAADLAALQEKLRQADAKIAELSATPEAAYAELNKQMSLEEVSMEDVDGILAGIEAFRGRFPASPLARELAGKVRGWQLTKKDLEKKIADEQVQEAAREMRTVVGDVEDGEDNDAAAAIRVAGHLEAKGLGFEQIARLPQTKLEEALKDPSSERGKVIVFTGNIAQISKDGDYFVGVMCSGFCSKVVYFVTKGTTKGLVEDKRATFAGVVTQRYSYANVRGGQTHSITLVGYFKGQ